MVVIINYRSSVLAPALDFFELTSNDVPGVNGQAWWHTINELLRVNSALHLTPLRQYFKLRKRLNIKPIMLQWYKGYNKVTTFQRWKLVRIHYSNTSTEAIGMVGVVPDRWSLKLWSLKAANATRRRGSRRTEISVCNRLSRDGVFSPTPTDSLKRVTVMEWKYRSAIALAEMVFSVPHPQIRGTTFSGSVGLQSPW